MTITIQSELKHEPAVGDGIRVYIVSSKSGTLQSSKAFHQTLPLNVESLPVMPGDTLDFVVEIGETLNSNQYLWTCTISDAAAESPRSWNSDTDFPHDPHDQLSPLEQLAQVLLCSNEFLFVD